MFFEQPIKIDMHVHTMEGSPDAKVPARELVRLYKEAGFGAIVVTEHVWEHYPELPMEERIEKWTSGYREAKDEGEKIGLKVFLGAETRLRRHGGEDFLVYGLEMENVEWLLRTLDSAQTLAELSQAVRVNGFFFAQAHPFRGECRAAEPELLDGVEAYNGKPRGSANNNHLAFDFAVENDLVMALTPLYKLTEACRPIIILDIGCYFKLSCAFLVGISRLGNEQCVSFL